MTVGARIYRELSIEIPGRPPTPNARPGNWQQTRRILDAWKADATTVAGEARRRWEISHGLRWTPLRQAELAVRFNLPDRRRRDWDNLIASIKPLLDGIVAADVLIDDSLEVIGAIAFTTARTADHHGSTTFTIGEGTP